ncbi:peptide-methionine (S)-S-oxide reductase MsrA [Terriglobus roseus]|uniref:Peptide methionine sulfoxide reductase MsrA n=1 Tax=Terriglobus roseus TaxID=392734 RepID=A0A1H4RUT7_9BACT|nr:peptide-methionine (S)-S-oxide reductase MsrA [Terriglobus roseus]SEC35568.1 peptide-methionine (S)-S-oxide reductase [Terriglobus roseus]
MAKAIATFAAGCFWGVEARLDEIPGVLETSVGYEGGTIDHPTYKDVCTGSTGHAEAVQITYDPSRVSYDALLDQFFSLHDPTQLNRQGPDFGTQYRSAVFVHDEQQWREAREKIADLNAAGVFRQPIATAIEPAGTFWKAEEYHQKYLEKRGMVACHI